MSAPPVSGNVRYWGNRRELDKGGHIGTRAITDAADGTLTEARYYTSRDAGNTLEYLMQH